jgi:hypothetical protein
MRLSDNASMARHLLLLIIRVCAVVLPLVALHRFVIADKPGYAPPARSGFRSTLQHENEAAFSMAWRVKMAELDMKEAQAEAKTISHEIDIARMAQRSDNVVGH